MPKGIINAMKEGYSKSGLDSKEINKRVYGHLNKIGAMHGSKETEKGVSMENKFEKHRGRRLSGLGD